MLTHLTKSAAAALRRGSINITQSLSVARPAVSAALSFGSRYATAFALAFAFAVVFGHASVAHAAVDTEITDMTTNAQTVFTSTKAIVLSVVGFGILLGFVKLLKKR